MFHAPLGRFQLEIIYYFTYFSLVFLSCRPFVVNSTRPVENGVFTTKGPQERNTQVSDQTTAKNRKNYKLILTENVKSNPLTE